MVLHINGKLAVTKYVNHIFCMIIDHPYRPQQSIQVPTVWQKKGKLGLRPFVYHCWQLVLQY